MSERPKTVSVAIAMEDGRIRKAFASHDAAVIIDLSNTLRDRYPDVAITTCELITKAPRVRKTRAKTSTAPDRTEG